MHWKFRPVVLAALVAVGLTAGCGKSSQNDKPDAGPDILQPPGDGGNDGGNTNTYAPIADLRADTNRDGVVSVGDDSDVIGKAEWTAERGAIFLANIDDDGLRCEGENEGPDAQLPLCNDALDDVVNGEDDVKDLAPLKALAWPAAKDDTYAQLFVSEAADAKVRLFKKVGQDWEFYGSGDPVNPPELREGVEFALEGKDILRDPAQWDGTVDLTWTVSYVVDGERKAKSDTVRLRVAPVMLFHHLEKAETVYVSNIAGWPEQQAFQNAIAQAVTAAQIPNPLVRHAVDDLWNQDYFETGYMSKPGFAGEQHVMRVNFRSADSGRGARLREGGRIIYELLGKDVGAIQAFDPDRNQQMMTLDAFGNTETIPPHSHNGKDYPLGRIIRGNIPSYHTDPVFTRMLEAQEVQKPVYADTSWLVVGHIDESISFLKVNTGTRGWVLLANDPHLAKQMLEAEVANGNGGAQMFVGKETYSGQNATRTINQVLANTNVMNESAAAALEVDEQVEIIKAATGITDEEIIRVPFLHENEGGASIAYQPGTVNMLVIDDKTLAVADPFGPVIDGKDIFKVQLEAQLNPLGYSIHWVDNWETYHVNLGEVHCATNAARTIPNAKWWEMAR